MRTTSVPLRVLRGAALVAQVLVVWLAAVLLAPRLSPARRRRLAARCAAQTLAIVRVRPRVHGAHAFVDGPVLVVANHVSWLDVYALNAVLGGARYVAKREVRRWPIAGGIAHGFGTFFHARGNVRDAARVKDAVVAALRAGERVVVFPEGTTTEGDGAGRFHAAFLQAAVDAAVPVQPVAIRYPDPDGGPDRAAAFVGDTTFLASLLRVLRRRRLDARLTVGPALDPRGRTRRDLTAASHAFVASVLSGGRKQTPSRPGPLRLPRAA
jgi:1-acyl-sn-glycerol-3-phosphate acyltransferase